MVYFPSNKIKEQFVKFKYDELGNRFDDVEVSESEAFMLKNREGKVFL